MLFSRCLPEAFFYKASRDRYKSRVIFFLLSFAALGIKLYRARIFAYRLFQKSRTNTVAPLAVK